MTSIRTLFATVVLLAAGAASAQNLPASTTFEVLMKNFSFADTAVGAVSFKQCDDCDYQRLRLTPRSEYSINGERMRFEEFQSAVADFRANDGDDINVNVRRDDASGTVASVFIYTS